MKIDFNLVVTLGPKEVVSTVLPVDQETVIGSGSGADISLQGDRISAQHASLVFDQGEQQWYVIAQEGDVRFRGELIEREAISLTKPFSIGPYLVRLEIKQAEEGERFELSEDSAIDGETPSGALAIFHQFVTYLRTHKRFSAVGAAIAVLFLGVSIFSGSDDLETPVSDGPKSYTIEQKREIDRYTSWVNDLWNKGDFATAVSVAGTAYANNSAKPELKKLYVDATHRQVSTLSEQGSFEQAKALLANLPEEIQLDESTQELSARVETDIKQKQAHVAQYREFKDKFELLIGQSELAFSDGDVERANRIVTSMSPLLTKFEPAWKKRKAALEVKIADAEARGVELMEQRRLSRIEKIKEVQKYFDKCLSLFRSGDRATAYVNCRAASTSADGEGVKKEIAVWLNLLEPDFTREINTLNDKAEDCYKNNWVECAFYNWQRMLVLDPTNDRTKNRLASAKTKQLRIARTKLREARAYTDIGRPKRALATLKELLLIYPLPESDVYGKAEKMIGDLKSET